MAAEGGSERDAPTCVPVDRKRTCPFLVRMYCRINGHHRAEEFAPPRLPVEDELAVYTWRDASLRELSVLVREVLGEQAPVAAGPGAAEPGEPGGARRADRSLRFSFRLGYPSPRRPGQFVFRDLGWAFDGAAPAGVANASHRTLESLRFLPGDIIDVAIYNNAALIPRPEEPVAGRK